jgi:hypothetical protein
MDFVRYLHPRLAPAALLRARMKRQALPWTLQWVDRVRQLPAAAVNAVDACGLEGLERAVPASDAVTRFLDDTGTGRRAGVAAGGSRVRPGGHRPRRGRRAASASGRSSPAGTT